MKPSCSFLSCKLKSRRVHWEKIKLINAYAHEPRWFTIFESLNSNSIAFKVKTPQKMETILQIRTWRIENFNKLSSFLNLISMYNVVEIIPVEVRNTFSKMSLDSIEFWILANQIEQQVQEKISMNQLNGRIWCKFCC